MSKEKNPIPELWQAFVLEIIDTDKSAIDNGWRWLCAISLLLDTTPDEMRKKLPKEHPLEPIKTSADLPTPLSEKTKDNLTKVINQIFKKQALESTIKRLKGELKNHKKIKKIDFSGLTFGEELKKTIDFSNFIFPIETDFSNTKFLKDVLFTDAVFLETADFENAKFHEKPVTYKETAKFKNAIFKKVANFNKAIFNGYANFKGATFSGRTIFQQAKFKFHAPRFYDTTFNNELILNRIGLPEATKDELPTIIRDQHNKDDTDNDIYQKTVEENKSAYETLIYLMEEQKKHHDKHRFFREEMRWRQLGNILTKERRIEETQENPPIEYPCFLRIEHNFTIAFFYLYDNIADYGYGIGRALAWWLVHILVGMIFIAIMVLFSFGICELCGYPQSSAELAKNLLCSIPVSFTNANPVAFIGIDKSSLMDCYDSLKKLNPLFFGIIRVTQTFLGIILLFLLLTTLRVRFRLDKAK